MPKIKVAVGDVPADKKMGEREVDATFVPRTNKMFAVNKKDVGAWRITHVPTGYCAPYLYANKRVAIKTAQEAYRRVPRKHLLKSSKISDVRRVIPQTVRDYMRSQGT